MNKEKKAKLFLNMIVGSFEPPEIVARSIDSVKDQVDGLYITVTYKDKKPSATHPLVKLLLQYKAHISYYKWTYNFAHARQYALDQVPSGPGTYIYWHDADDVLQGAENLHRVADEALVQNVAAVYFVYWYMVSLDEAGNVKDVLIEQKRERVVRHDNTFKWIGDLHETLIEQKKENLLRIGRPECTVIHMSDNDRIDAAIDRNIEILEKAYTKEKGKDPRTTVYLAKSYFDKAKMMEEKDRQSYFDKSLPLFYQYLNGAGVPGSKDYVEPSGWPEERSTAWSAIAEIAVLSGKYDVAVQAYQSAIDEAPHFPSLYVDMAMTYATMKDFKKAKHWLMVATNIPEPDTTIVTYPRELRIRALETSVQINLHEQKLENALRDLQELYQIIPESQDVKSRIATLNTLIEYNKACQSFVYLGKYLESVDEKGKIAKLIEALPQGMEQEKFATQMRHLFIPPRTWGKNEIAIVCGPGFEKWSPKNVETGIGGSEEAIVYLSQELTKLGWRVTVYANPQDDAGEYDGVTYKQWNEVNPMDSFNILILWRGIGFIDVNPKSAFTMVWMHDVPSNPDFTEERLEKVDKVAVLSEYHKSLLRVHKKDGTFAPFPEDKVFLTSNGIAHITVDPTITRDPKRMIYSSSPDRGLGFLLTNWPKIKGAVNDAELHVFYGFDVFDAIHRNNPAEMKWKAYMMQLMKQDGVHYHGRIGHQQLHAEMQKAGVWAYPTNFTEISCITGMKAQALGAFPVVTNYAALEETVKNGSKVDVDITTKEGQEEYVAALIDVLKNPEKQEEIREQMMTWAQEYFAWSGVAFDWDELFRVNVQNPERRYESETTIA